MKNCLLLLFVGLSAFLSAQQTNQTIDVNGTSRQYIQYLPTGFNAANESLPLVFVLHGLGGNASQMTVAGTNNIADTARFIVVYPDGKPNFQGQQAWANGTALQSTVDDISFFNKMIDRYIIDYNVDPTRVYSCGLSMGGIMSYTLACELNDRIAAIGAMSGTMSTTTMNSCNPVYKTPVIHFHGTADAVVPYNSGALPTLTLVPETMNYWINVHGCYSSSDSTQIPNTANDGLTVDRFVYQNCTPSESVELWRINGGDHTYFFEPLNDFTENIEIWRFFTRWQHSNPAAVSIDEHTLGEVTRVFPNPTAGIVSLESPVQQSITVLDIQGNFIGEIAVSAGTNSIDLSYAGGVYLLQFSDGSVKRVSVR